MNQLFRHTPGNGPPRAGGFTFVEVVVVGVIVAILAVVSIPIYSGYVKNQRRQTALSVAQTAAVTANSIFRRLGNTHPTNDELNAEIFLSNPAQYSVEVVVKDVVVTQYADRINRPTDTVKALAAFRP
jgi:Tfp pilus assembly protein PilE